MAKQTSTSKRGRKPKNSATVNRAVGSVNIPKKSELDESTLLWEYLETPNGKAEYMEEIYKVKYMFQRVSVLEDKINEINKTVLCLETSISNLPDYTDSISLEHAVVLAKEEKNRLEESLKEAKLEVAIFLSIQPK